MFDSQFLSLSPVSFESQEIIHDNLVISSYFRKQSELYESLEKEKNDSDRLIRLAGISICWPWCFPNGSYFMLWCNRMPLHFFQSRIHRRWSFLSLYNHGDNQGWTFTCISSTEDRERVRERKKERETGSIIFLSIVFLLRLFSFSLPSSLSRPVFSRHVTHKWRLFPVYVYTLIVIVIIEYFNDFKFNRIVRHSDDISIDILRTTTSIV